MQVTTGGSKVSPGVKALLTLLAALLLVSGFSMGTWSAFSTVKANSGNSFAAGTVLLSDNDSGNAMMSLVSGKPFDSVSACVVVTYTGTLPGTVRLYGSTTGTGLAQYLNLTVTRGTMASPVFPSCTGFNAATASPWRRLDHGQGFVATKSLHEGSCRTNTSVNTIRLSRPLSHISDRFSSPGFSSLERIISSCGGQRGGV
jgi:hypothetical protein